MMSKLFLLIVIIVAGLALATGVLQVQIHPERLASAPADAMRVATNGTLLEQARAVGIGLKRKVELYSAEHENQKLEVALGFVRQDASRLEELVAKKPNIETLIPQAELLAKSINQARTLAQDVSEGDLADMRALSEEAFSLAGGAMGKLAAFQQELQTNSDQLTEVLQDIAPAASEGDVAGSHDEANSDDSSATETQQEEAPLNTSIPLRF